MGFDFSKIMKLLAAFNDLKDVVEEVVDPAEKAKLKAGVKEFIDAIKEVF